MADDDAVAINLRIELIEVPGRGWVIHAPDIRASASGETRGEAYLNLQRLVHRYPEIVEELKERDALRQ